MQGPLISVIVPIYKVEAYLSKCVNSLLAQTYENIEIILVDDGSPDNCPQVCDEFAKSYANVKTYHKENGGLSSARNYGVERANGEYVAFVDSDDYVEPNYVSDMYKLLTEFGADMCVTRVRRQKENSASTDNYKRFNDYCIDGNAAFFEIYRGGDVGWQAYGKLIKKEVMLNNPFPNGYYEDFAVMYKILRACSKIAIGDYRNNYHYIQREGSILVSQINEKHLHIFDLCDEINEYIKAEYPKSCKFKCLSVMIYKRSVIQLLNLVNMTDEDFNMIFLKYRKLFRKNCLKILFSKHFNLAQKKGLLLLCLNSKLYKKILKMS